MEISNSTAHPSHVEQASRDKLFRMSARGLNAVTNRALLQAETYARQLSHHFASSSAAAPAHERAVPTSNAAVEALRQKLAEGKSADQQQSHAAQLVCCLSLQQLTSITPVLQVPTWASLQQEILRLASTLCTHQAGR